MSNIFVAALVVFNIWLGLKYLFLPGWRLRKWLGSYSETARGEAQVSAMSHVLIHDVDPKRAKLVAWSMMVSFFFMLWTLTLWASVHGMGGVESFCSILLDRP